MRRERSILIAATREAVYDYVSDVMRHPDWAAQEMEMKHTGGPDAGAGAEFESSVHFMGHVAGRIKVIEASRPERFVYQCQDTSGRYNWTFNIQQEGSGTRLTQSFDRLNAPFYVKVIQPALLYPLLGKGMFDKDWPRSRPTWRARLQQPAPDQPPEEEPAFEERMEAESRQLNYWPLWVLPFAGVGLALLFSFYFPDSVTDFYMNTVFPFGITFWLGTFFSYDCDIQRLWIQELPRKLP
jgi:hypothetical protein